MAPLDAQAVRLWLTASVCLLLMACGDAEAAAQNAAACSPPEMLPVAGQDVAANSSSEGIAAPAAERSDMPMDAGMSEVAFPEPQPPALELAPDTENGAGVGAPGAQEEGIPFTSDRPDCAAVEGEAPRLCVFDYDLTLSRHGCVDTTAPAPVHCRRNSCGTYGWLDQCVAPAARSAIAECVRRGAFIGIASHADVDGCWPDKVTPIIEQQQFPEWLASVRYDSAQSDWSYPALDQRDHWNCERCAYHMNPSLSKPDAIRRVMAHYGLDPERGTDRARVIFWDDSETNIDQVRQALPEANAVLVAREDVDFEVAGCGLRESDIDRGWCGALAP